jgi:hypothetical protein
MKVIFAILAFTCFTARAKDLIPVRPIDPGPRFVKIKSSIENQIPTIFSSTDPKQSRFDALADKYTHGTNVTYEQIKAFYTGRCYHYSEPNKPRNIMLGYLEQRLGDDPGPAFPDDRQVKKDVFGIISESKPADYFDNPDKFEEQKTTLINLLRPASARLEMKEDPTLTETQSSGKKAFADFSYVAFQTYYLQKATMRTDSKVYNPWNPNSSGNAKVGDVIQYCYFFQKMGN